jgi:signal peptidase I
VSEAVVSGVSVRSLKFTKTRKWISRFTWGLLAIFVLLIGTIGIAVRTDQVRLAPVLSGSMRPLIHEGDIVVTRPISAESLRKGDIIVFHPPGYTGTKVHRIASIEHLAGGKIAFTTKGDANKLADPWGKVTTQGTAYKVSVVIPRMGWLVNGGLRWIITGLTFLFALVIIRWVVQYVRS